jgi:1,4-alpha-glucan branching enzyme
MIQGYVAPVLHAHLPFVRHPEYPEFLEEDWLYEAITETYLPLLDMMEGLVRDGVYFRLTMSMTPPLCAMLRDPLLQGRYVRGLEKQIELAGKELHRTKNDSAFHPLARFYHDRLHHCRHLFCDRYHRNLIAAFRKFQDAGVLEIITCGATHGFLPLMKEFPQAVRAQIQVARNDYRNCFGRDPRGIWLPECAYYPGLEDHLQESEIRWFIVDAHGLIYAEPRPAYGVFAPIFTPAGPAAFGRDIESSKQVWSAEEGYPGDGEYRDFYRDCGFDLDHDYIRPYIQPNGMRKFTGLKYHRITGRTSHKEPYRPELARQRAADHAANFMFNRGKQIEHLRGVMGVEPIVLCPYDAELYGHWWYEGPIFLDYLFRKAAYDQKTFSMITPSEFLTRHDTHQIGTPSASSWGNEGHWSVWLEGSNAWIYPHLHVATNRMIELAQRYRNQTPHSLCDRALRQAARELLLAQSSDWAFIMKTGTMVPYAVKRTKDHLLRFQRLYEQILADRIEESFLGNCEWRNPIFLDLDWRVYA